MKVYNKIFTILNNNKYSFLFFFIGILIFFFPVIFIQHDLMPGDLGDGRFVNYILEHGYLFLKRVYIHKYFWDLPIFYPHGNTLAYSDILLGGMITYIPVRFIINNPHIAYLVWFFTNCTLNYFSMYYLLRMLKLKPLSSSFGAFLFAFSLPRFSSIYHLQLFTQYITVFGTIFLFKLNKAHSKRKNLTLLTLSFLSFVLQLYTSFYLGFFIFYSFVILFFISVFSKNLRKKIFDFVLFYKKELIISISVSMITLLPLIYHYLLVGARFPYTTLWIIKPEYFLASQSFLDNIFICTPEPDNYEIFIGMGIVTTIFSLFVIFKNLKETKYYLMFILIILISFSFEPLYYSLYSFFPAASAIRAATRSIFIILPVLCFLNAKFLDKIKNKIILCLVLILLIAEQIPHSSNFKWSIREHNRRLNYYTTSKNCSVVTYNILYEPYWKYTLDIMWIATRDKFIITNGYSGYEPSPSSFINSPQCTFNTPKISNRFSLMGNFPKR